MYICPNACGLTFSERKVFNNHIRHRCTKLNTLSRRAKKALLTKFNAKPLSFVCPLQCGVVYTQQKRLKEHLARSHDKDALKKTESLGNEANSGEDVIDLKSCAPTQDRLDKPPEGDLRSGACADTPKMSNEDKEKTTEDATSLVNSLRCVCGKAYAFLTNLIRHKKTCLLCQQVHPTIEKDPLSKPATSQEATMLRADKKKALHRFRYSELKNYRGRGISFVVALNDIEEFFSINEEGNREYVVNCSVVTLQGVVCSIKLCYPTHEYCPLRPLPSQTLYMFVDNAHVSQGGSLIASKSSAWAILNQAHKTMLTHPKLVITPGILKQIESIFLQLPQVERKQEHLSPEGFYPRAKPIAYTTTTLRQEKFHVKFPFPPYEQQIALADLILAACSQGESALLASPTGTGKTLAFLCALMAFNEKKARGQRHPILYASRTHEQLDQVLTEYSKTVYNDHLAIVLGSKGILCYKGCKHNSSRALLKSATVSISALKECGERCHSCPYHISRKLVPYADLILLPYNYLFLPSVVGRLNSTFKAKPIIVFDEGHNLISAAENVYCFSLALGRMKKVMNCADEHANTVMRILENSILSELTAQKLIADIVESVPDSYWRKPKQFLNPLFRTDPDYEIGARNWRQLSDAVRTIGCGPPANYVKVLYTREKDKDSLLSFVCPIAKYAYATLLELAPVSVLVTSGTLPNSEITSALPHRFTIEGNMDPIIKPGNLLSLCVCLYGPANFSFTYRNRTVGQCLLLSVLLKRIRDVAQGGVLAFLPSYQFMNQLREAWASESILSDDVVWEDRGNKTATRDAHCHNIDVGKHSLLIGVGKGTFAEGLNLSNKYARIVVIVGIPYASLHSEKVKQKKAYMTHAGQNFSAWYNTDATQTMCQCMGRIIRHPDDYGAILLVGVEHHKNVSSFPKWLAPTAHVNICEGVTKVSEFLKSKHPVKEPTQQPAEEAPPAARELTFPHDSTGKELTISSNEPVWTTFFLNIVTLGFR